MEFNLLTTMANSCKRIAGNSITPYAVGVMDQ